MSKYKGSKVYIPGAIVNYLNHQTKHVRSPFVPLGPDSLLVLTTSPVVESMVQQKLRENDRQWERFTRFNEGRWQMLMLLEKAMLYALNADPRRLSTFLEGVSTRLGGLWADLYLESEHFPHIHQHWHNKGIPAQTLNFIRAIKAAENGDKGKQLRALADDSLKAVIFEIQSADPDTPPQHGKGLENQTKLLAPWCIDYRKKNRCTWEAAGLAYKQYLGSIHRTDTETRLLRTIENYEQKGELGHWIGRAAQRYKRKGHFRNL